MPDRKKGESAEEFVSRCMSSEIMKEEYPDSDQRLAVCISKSRAENTTLADEVYYLECDPSKFLETEAAEYQGKKVTLNKPFRTPDGPKKFAVYVKNDKGTVVIVRFGDPNMEIKKDDPERRKSFLARHKCDNPGPKWKSRFWACWSWREGNDI